LPKQDHGFGHLSGGAESEKLVTGKDLFVRTGLLIRLPFRWMKTILAPIR
jgi:hypothetical protein